MLHSLKAIPESFRLISERESNVQLRLNDRGFCARDEIVFREWLPERSIYTGRETVPITVRIILEDHEGLTQGWCLLVLAIPTANITRYVPQTKRN